MATTKDRNRKAFVLLSGGADSTTCLYKAIHDFMPEDPGLALSYGDKSLIKEALSNPEAHSTQIQIPWVEAVSINYGQRHSIEIEFAKQLTRYLGIKHSTIQLPEALDDENTMLTRKDIQIPDVSYSELPEGVSPTYVPFRNGTMLALLTAHAQKWINAENKKRAELLDGEMLACDVPPMPTAGIYFGAHAEDAHNWAYPDCTPEFIGAMANAIFVGSYYQIRLYTPLMTLTKAEVIKLGDSLGVPYRYTWSCYKGEGTHCGTCPTCRSRQEAFKLAGVRDPTIYAKASDADAVGGANVRVGA
jgi:7-cyano-7-deazaguanine synthase